MGRWGRELLVGLASPLSGHRPGAVFARCLLGKGWNFGNARSPRPQLAGPRPVSCGDGALKHPPGFSGWAGVPGPGCLHPLAAPVCCSPTPWMASERGIPSGQWRRWRMLLPEPGMVSGPGQSRGTFPRAAVQLGRVGGEGVERDVPACWQCHRAGSPSPRSLGISAKARSAQRLAWVAPAQNHRPLHWDFPLLGCCTRRVSQRELELGEVLNPRRVGNLSLRGAGGVPRRHLPALGALASLAP